MGTFRLEVTVSNPRDPTRSVTLPLLADGREERWPIAPVLVRLDGGEGPSLALIGRAGAPALLGAVTLEELALGVDPSGRRLIPTTSLA
jgi:hypothetical protein